jgi:lysophospholipase L1-like esterase
MTRTLLTILLLALAAPAQAITIVAFGDSTTAHRTLDDNSQLVVYGDLLQAELLGILGQPVTVINSGVPSDSTTLGLTRLSSAVLNYDPDYVVIQFGANDALVDGVDGVPRVALSTYTDNLQSMVEQIVGAGATPILMTPFPLNSLIGVSWPWSVYDTPQFGDLQNSYASAMGNLALSNSIPFVDVVGPVLQYRIATGNPYAATIDYIHPNAIGHRMEADLLEAVFATTAVPEPGSWVLMGLGFFSLAFRRKLV